VNSLLLACSQCKVEESACHKFFTFEVFVESSQNRGQVEQVQQEGQNYDGNQEFCCLLEIDGVGSDEDSSA